MKREEIIGKLKGIENLSEPVIIVFLKGGGIVSGLFPPKNGVNGKRIIFSKAVPGSKSMVFPYAIEFDLIEDFRIETAISLSEKIGNGELVLAQDLSNLSQEQKTVLGVARFILQTKIHPVGRYERHGD